MGFFVQDSWTIDRLTVNAGLRVRALQGADLGSGGRGRPLRRRRALRQGRRACRAGSTSRRASASSYDLFGNAQTALKGTINKYMAGQTLSYAQRYNPLRLQFDTRHLERCRTATTSRRTTRSGRATTWRSGCRCSRRGRIPTASTASTTSKRASASSTSCCAACRCRVRGSAARRTTSAAPTTSSSASATTRRSTSSARSTAQVFTVYNLDPSKRGQIDTVDTNSTNGDLRSRVYNGYELGVNGRMRGARSSAAGRSISWSSASAIRSTIRTTTSAAPPTAGLVRSEGARHPVPPRVQAVRIVHAAVRHPGERGVPELCGPVAWHLLGYRLDDRLRAATGFTAATAWRRACRERG